MTNSLPSKSKVNAAGRLLRGVVGPNAEPISDWGDVSDALDIVEAWRAAHAAPLQAASMGLRSRVNTVGCWGQVSQRLKRVRTILDKLQREPRMELARMSDIGGCRAVVPTIDDVRRIQDRYQSRAKVRYVRDYIANPKPSGYRAVHLVVEHRDRLIELQLRTKVMHEWAVMVERITVTTGTDVKSGYGAEEVNDWFRAVSEAMAIEEQGLTVDAILAQRIDALRTRAWPHLHGGQQWRRG
ncbi:RelA/SpoT domain-containing protein [Rhodococcus ruber]|uniref:RelA/SpoT domain-containing protein n=1 Tax=Rhodococcus ruber TaxID=1830 RepID=UPI001F1BBD68|nr:RelA/SpoT domain-containing protein [Rhodococcus ruber]MCF8784121.1 RelA/SpoT domain-containing protein [Rhodococcus ruber]